MKKIIITLVSALIISCFAACGGTADTSAPQDDFSIPSVEIKQGGFNDDSSAASNAAGEQDESKESTDAEEIVEEGRQETENVDNGDSGNEDVLD